MSIWGKIVGGVAGFAIGGPIGSLLGLLVGHAVDKTRQQNTPDGLDLDSKQMLFATAVVVLCAKMAKVDGQVTRDEIRAFKEVFKIRPSESAEIGRLFNMARDNPEGFEPFAKQIATMFRGQPHILEDLLGALIHIARADNVVHPAEVDYLERVARIFGFSQQQFASIASRFSLNLKNTASPYQILGLSPKATNDEIKRTYRKLVRENHPDKLIAEGLPQEFIDVATEKLANINAAYEQIREERGLS